MQLHDGTGANVKSAVCNTGAETHYKQRFLNLRILNMGLLNVGN